MRERVIRQPSRRGLLAALTRLGAATLAGVAAPGSLRGRAASATGPAERSPLVAGMAPSTVRTSKGFLKASGHEFVLNTQVQTEQEVQDRFDTAVLEMFNVMHANMALFSSGEVYGYLAQSNVPQGIDLQAFGQQLRDGGEGEMLIPLMYYPKEAQTTADALAGQFDPKRGLRLYFVQQNGLFDISWLAATGEQIFGFTPRLRSNGGLQLDIHEKHEVPPPHIQYPDMAQDIASTWVASNMMQIMMLSYGIRDAYVANARQQHDRLFNAPYTVNDVIASNLSGKQPGESYWDYGSINYASLLDYRPLSPSDE